MKLPRFVSAIRDIGTSGLADPEDRYGVRIINLSALIASLSVILSVPLKSWISRIDMLEFGPVYLVFALGFLLTIFLNFIRKRTVAVYWLFSLPCILIFVSTSLFGYESGTHFYFLVIIYGVILSFREKNFHLMLFIGGLCVALVILLVVTDFSLLLIEDRSPENKYRINLFQFTVCIIVAVSLTAVYVKNRQGLVWSLKTSKIELSKQNRKLEIANKELDLFVYRSSHDLRAPIASATGLLELLKTVQEKEERDFLLELLHQRLERMDEFILDLNFYAYNKNGEICMSQIEVPSLLESVKSKFLSVGNTQGIRITTKITGEKKIIYTDKKRLERALEIIVSNAVQYADINKPNKWIQITAEVDTSWTIFRISDNGIGIADSIKDKIFDMFFRGINQGEGSGLGLYLVKETLHKIGGEVTFESVEGEGSTFIISLAASKPEGTQTPEKLLNPKLTDEEVSPPAEIPVLVGANVSE
ncbi:MAG: HAMP domain-containing sensor histidine kinase [Bacteroidota bacterium]